MSHYLFAHQIFSSAFRPMLHLHSQLYFYFLRTILLLASLFAHSFQLSFPPTRVIGRWSICTSNIHHIFSHKHAICLLAYLHIHSHLSVLRYIPPFSAQIQSSSDNMSELREFLSGVIQDHRKTFNKDCPRDYIDAFLAVQLHFSYFFILPTSICK